MSRSPEGYGSGASGLIHLAAKESKRPPMISLSLNEAFWCMINQRGELS